MRILNYIKYTLMFILLLFAMILKSNPIEAVSFSRVDSICDSAENLEQIKNMKTIQMNRTAGKNRFLKSLLKGFLFTECIIAISFVIYIIICANNCNGD